MPTRLRDFVERDPVALERRAAQRDASDAKHVRDTSGNTALIKPGQDRQYITHTRRLDMSRSTRSLFRPLCAALAVASLTLVAGAASLAKESADEETTALLQVLSESKVGLADGIRQVAKGGEAAISAKLELDDNNKLSLSVYTAEKGLGEDAEHNVLKEFSGSPAQPPWSPEVEVFKDLPHVSRASEQLALMALAKQPLADLVMTAQKQHKGMVFSAIPEVYNHRPVLVVLVADHGKVNAYRYDLVTDHALR